MADVQTPPAPPQEQTTPEQQAQPTRAQGLAAAVAAVDDLRKRTFRYRDALAPHLTVFGMWGLGALLHAAEVPVWQVLAGEAAVAGVTAAVRGMFPKLRARLASRWWWAAAGAWLPLAAALGATGFMQSLMFAVGGLLTIPRVFRYRIRINRPVIKSRPKEIASPQARPAIEGPDPIVGVWQAKTARKTRGALQGSVLTDRRPFAYGVRYRIVLEGQTTEDAMGARKQICSDFGKAIDYVHVEETDDGALNTAELTILDRLAVEDIQRWSEPLLDMETGVLPLGPFADGSGDAAIQVWEPGSGPLPAGIFGAMRVGKSSLIKLAATEFRRAGVDEHGNPLISLLYMDPQAGQSCPSVLPHVPKAALGIDQIRELLLALRQEMYDRNAMLREVEWTDEFGNQQKGKQSFDRPGMNGLDLRIAAIDEAHRVLRHEDLAEIVHELLAEGSKCGITVWILEQSALVNHVGGGDILDLLNSGNLVVLRTGNAYTAQATFGQRLEVYPHMIKKTFPSGGHTKGSGYVLGATTRPVMMRIRDIENLPAAVGDGPKPVLRWMSASSATSTTSSQEQPAQQPMTAPDDPDPEVIDLDNVVNFTPIDPQQQAEVERRVLALLEGAEQGLDGGDLTLGAEVPLPIVFRVVTALIESGQVRQAGDRYVREAS